MVVDGLAAQGASGCLEVDGDPGGGIYLDQGKITFAWSARTPGLTARLRPVMPMAADSLELSDNGADDDIAARLLALDGVSRNDLSGILVTITIDAITALTEHGQEGSITDIRFNPGAVHWAGSLCRLSAAETWPAVAGAADRMAARPVAMAEPLYLSDLAGDVAVLSRDQWSVAARADGVSPARDLAWACGLALYQTAGHIGDLIEAGLATQVAPAEVAGVPGTAPAEVAGVPGTVPAEVAAVPGAAPAGGAGSPAEQEAAESAGSPDEQKAAGSAGSAGSDRAGKAVRAARTGRDRPSAASSSSVRSRSARSRSTRPAAEQAGAAQARALRPGAAQASAAPASAVQPSAVKPRVAQPRLARPASPRRSPGVPAEDGVLGEPEQAAATIARPGADHSELADSGSGKDESAPSPAGSPAPAGSSALDSLQRVLDALRRLT